MERDNKPKRRFRLRLRKADFIIIPIAAIIFYLYQHYAITESAKKNKVKDTATKEVKEVKVTSPTPLETKIKEDSKNPSLLKIKWDKASQEEKLSILKGLKTKCQAGSLQACEDYKSLLYEGVN
ncbi:hypothetical protein [Helicobacter sp. 11S02629-2]|uniref:hypothetical protein n=1 Tax=Helicobacter sp. 11S02629-2 TaxID=1476195 RepID=UPI000BA5058A|nr:hypothetical protein [Helicobacter sp. 11S02629-2]PAF44090.1 hypothetical protein BKH40_06370 [Helicobacter sp. 11S02629-2]